MKNYVVISQFTNEGNVFATLHVVENMDNFAKSTLEAMLAICTELPAVPSDCTSIKNTTLLERNKLYKFDFDAFETTNGAPFNTLSSSYEEHVLRALGFRKCDVCGSWVCPQEIRDGLSIYANGQRKCAACIAREEQQDANNRKITLGHYHSTTSFKVWNEDNTLSDILADGQYLGIEMEVNGSAVSIRNRQFKATDEFYAIANNRSRKQVFHCEEDCTVKAEFISNCFTKNSFRAFNWDILTEQTKKMGNDEKYPQVGFHIHLSKTLLGATEQEQVDNFLKLQYVLNKYENDFYKVSGRNSRSEMGYCGFWSLDQIDRLRNAASGSTSAWSVMPRYHDTALISSGHTIELRICHSTNDSERIRHTLELVWNLVENIKNVRWEKLWCLGKLFKMVPSETMNYWRQKGCFLNTFAVDTRGMSATVSC